MMRTLFIVLCLASSLVFAEKEIAITIDDLPLVASRMDTPGNQQRATERFSKIVQALVDNKVPATGFVIAGAIEKGQWAFLEQFRQAGFELGNHTYSHRSLNQIGADRYIADIEKADKILNPLMTEPKYFRYPYLAEGANQTREKVHQYLAEQHYVIAPVTIDSDDFRFNEMVYRVPYRSREAYIQKLKPRYLAYIWNRTLRAEKKAKNKNARQILLLHANVLNSYVLGDIIAMYRKNGYQFITLTQALENPAPELDFSFENAIRKNKGSHFPY
ncbi:polysaccharide deacetylase [Legionella taurinensis]|uniref:Polysaccharide deacetylase n=2 Tax=Legionella taurinensis TaxID=70611 RepID=A0A3A5LN84_9GAMM|nr:polysaccharide deacetylase family protein [Legionella taurinensis]MDX1837897.1 polysaccharide deacetylase family protein [Legionella taurinensis]PUT39601.1 polysaccharide deacetylase [Legionella taurinensis]PUT43296.1 polysaccharide deacetylase [Legionella taurinensis]PUT45741.1 polysaccharide deacetylase [Legionella taurinensis]PUT47654.1 polysaccharide deacetylase [Legionella taurinensis]